MSFLPPSCFSKPQNNDPISALRKENDVLKKKIDKISTENHRLSHLNTRNEHTKQENVILKQFIATIRTQIGQMAEEHDKSHQKQLRIISLSDFQLNKMRDALSEYIKAKDRRMDMGRGRDKLSQQLMLVEQERSALEVELAARSELSRLENSGDETTQKWRNKVWELLVASKQMEKVHKEEVRVLKEQINLKDKKASEFTAKLESLQSITSSQQTQLRAVREVNKINENKIKMTELECESAIQQFRTVAKLNNGNLENLKIFSEEVLGVLRVLDEKVSRGMTKLGEGRRGLDVARANFVDLKFAKKLRTHSVAMQTEIHGTEENEERIDWKLKAAHFGNKIDKLKEYYENQIQLKDNLLREKAQNELLGDQRRDEVSGELEQAKERCQNLQQQLEALTQKYGENQEKLISSQNEINLLLDHMAFQNDETIPTREDNIENLEEDIRQLKYLLD